MPEQPIPPMPSSSLPTPSSRTVLVRRAYRLARGCELLATVSLLAAAVLLLFLFTLQVGAGRPWHYLPLAVSIFSCALAIGVTAPLLAHLRSVGLGWVGLLLGLLCIKFPLIIALLGNQFHFASRTPFLDLLDRALPGLGAYLIVISTLHLIGANIYAIMHSRQLLDERFRPCKEGEGHDAAKVSFIPRCWEMSPCPEAVRAKCPNFLDQIPCWKRRLGCLCDHRLAGYLYHKNTPVATDTAHTQRIDLTAPQNPEQYPAQMRSEPSRSWKSRRPFCHNCAIFLEHQGFKYRRLNWIFLPISLLLLLVLLPFYHVGYGLCAGRLDALSRALIASGKMPTDVASAGMLLNSPYEYVLLCVLALLLMSYVVEFTDMCLLEWKL